MSDNSLFDMFDLSKTDELLKERARAENQLKDQELKIQFRGRRSSAYSLVDEQVSPEEIVSAPPITATDQDWYEQLPEKIRPLFLRVRYTRVMRKIASAWIDVAATRSVFDELLLVERESRAGFPPAALQELHALRDYYFDVLHPKDTGRPFKP